MCEDLLLHQQEDEDFTKRKIGHCNYKPKGKNFESPCNIDSLVALKLDGA